MILYISDLDGTLLNSKGKLTNTTVRIINNLIARGMCFSIATARGIDTVKDILKPLDIKCPIILNNGLFIYDLKEDKVINEHFIDINIALDIYDIFKTYGIKPMVRVKKNKKYKLYYSRFQSKIANDFISNSKLKYIQELKDSYFKASFDLDILSIFTIGKKNKLEKIAEFLKDRFPLKVDFYCDNYNDYYWLEINPILASKGIGALYLKNMYNIDNLITFGDNLNDISMFKISKKSYGMLNGNSKILNYVDSKIDSNDNDSVAKELLNLFNNSRLSYEIIS